MFWKKANCDICGIKLHRSNFTQLTDGKICPFCARVCNGSGFAAIDTVKQVLAENDRRYREFHESKVVTSILCGFIFIDFDHQWAYVSRKKKVQQMPVVFHFSEIEHFSIKQLGSKTVTETKTKSGIRRAFVGQAIAGPVGAIVGSTTARSVSETKTVGGTRTLILKLNINGLKSKIVLFNPPYETENMLNSMMES